VDKFSKKSFMKITVINTGFFKLDGGAMFGVVPRRIWEKLNPPDENNLCTWAMRCLLVEINDRKILIDAGIGDKQDARFRSHFEPHGTNSLLQNLDNQGIKAEDITDVFLTHLHFDHCGGVLSKYMTNNSIPKIGGEGSLVPTFPNATHWSNKRHWDWAMHPNPREQASFLKENFEPLQALGKLKFVEEKEGIELFPNFFVHFAFGHTEAMMMIRLVADDGRTFFYPADLLPSSWHVNMPYIMAYDVRPLNSLTEKAAILERAVAENWHIFFEHDPTTACATVKRNEAGRIVINERFDL
jgi:glyoxylase-like metal-dependent hydrolase (beta-lactamase superfamily II)